MSWKNLPRSSNAPLDRRALPSAEREGGTRGLRDRDVLFWLPAGARPRVGDGGNERVRALSLSKAKTWMAGTSPTMTKFDSRPLPVGPRESGDPVNKCRDLSLLASRWSLPPRRRGRELTGKDMSSALLPPAPT